MNNNPLTWNELATEYDRYYPGSMPARVLDFDTVFNRMAKTPGFHVDPDKGTIHRIEDYGNDQPS